MTPPPVPTPDHDWARKTKRPKFRNVPTFVDGHRFASKLEARRYSELKLLQRGRAIDQLELQPRFRIEIGGVHVCDYVADFAYVEGLARVVEDTKGVMTPDCRIKLNLMKAVHGIEVKLVRRAA